MKKLVAVRNGVAGLGVLIMAVFGGAPGRADWPNSNITKWVQYPEFTNGLNVLATAPVLLADDFLCTTSGPITDIHIWGSWWEDRTNTQPIFTVSFYSDVPAGGTNLFSRPGNLLWQASFLPGAYAVSNWGPTVNERFYDPVATNDLGAETNLIQYNFYVSPASAFVQTNGNVYWLGITATGFDTNQFLFGWKTSTNHFNDNAVYFADGSWKELVYPSGHPLAGGDLDLAFALTTVPEPGTAAALLAVAGVGLSAVRRRRRA